jgi:hypothetical protein
MAVLGVSAAQNAAAVAGPTMVDPSKAWSVGASLRGFYDDNYTTAPNDVPGLKRSSLGFSVSPFVSYNMPMEQTTLGFRYIYGAYWYEDRTDQNSSNNPWDMSHQFDAYLNHSFSERYSLNASDSFVVSQEPELLQSGAIALPYRTKGDNIRNLGQINFNGTLTRQLSFVVGYQNTYYNYEQHGGNAIAPSLSGLLDRTEHLALFNLRYQMLPDTVFVLGYNYGTIVYNSGEQILPALAIYPVTTSAARNNHSHYAYAGIDQNFSKDLLLTIRGGAQWIDYYNDPLTQNAVSPYGQVTLSYNYLPDSNVQLGWTLSHSQTDVLAIDPTTGSFTSDQLSSVLYAAVNHRFDARWSGRVMGSWQLSEYNNGLYDNKKENFFDVGVNLTYRFNQYLSGEVGYDYYLLNSDLPLRDYDRNRVYIGLIAAY